MRRHPIRNGLIGGSFLIAVGTAAVVWASPGGITTRVSVASDGTEAEEESLNPSISADGRYVVFESWGESLAGGDIYPNGDIYIHDRVTGETSLITGSGFHGIWGTFGYFSTPSISADGRYVAFFVAPSVPPLPTTAPQVLVYDRETGETEVASVATDGTLGLGIWPHISGNGRHVAFISEASNLVENDTNGSADVFVRNLDVGETIRVSVSSNGLEGNDHSAVFNPDQIAISADGRFVVFESRASNLIDNDTNEQSDVFVHDRQTGETARVSVASDGSASGGQHASISGDGRYVVFRSAAPLAGPGSSNGWHQVFVNDRQTGELTVASVSSGEALSREGNIRFLSISADGRLVAFATEATNLVPNDTNGVSDVFLRNLQTGETTRVSVASDGTEGNGESIPLSSGLAISTEGQLVAFASAASNLVPNDTNGFPDIFVRELEAQEPTPTVDLSISDVVPIQVVEGANLNDEDGREDLVLGKPLIVRVEIRVDDPEGIPDGQTINTELTFQGAEFSIPKSVEELFGNDSTEAIVDFSSLDFPGLTPSNAGDFSIVAFTEFEGSNSISDPNPDNNADISQVTIKDTTGLYVAYMRVDCLGGLDTYVDTVFEAGEFLRALLPVAPSEFTNQRFDASITCKGDFFGDSIQLWLEGKVRSLGRAKKIVGIVDQNWADARIGGDFGVTWCGASRAFVLDGRWEGVAHEIGHGLELNHPGENPCKAPPGSGSTDGYWVESGVSPGQVRGLPSLMGPGSLTPPNFPEPDRWIRHSDYEYVFENEFATEPNDPEILLVSGFLHNDGTLELGPFYQLSEGVVDDPSAGDYAIQVLDFLGNELYALQFDAQFILLTHPPVETDIAPFGFAIPFPGDAAIVQVSKNGVVLGEAHTTSKLLSDVVALIPDDGFLKNPSQRRNALLNKIEALDGQLAAGDLNGALGKLENDVRKHVDRWLLDEYLVSSPLEYTKSEILELIDELLERLAEN